MITIQRATDTEIRDIIQNHSAQAMFEGGDGTFRPTQERVEQLNKTTLEKGAFYLLAKDGEQLAGWVMVGSNKDFFSEEMIGFIYELYVFPEYRGKGIAKELMTEGISALREEGYEEIRLNVFAGNQGAKRLYESLGFLDRQTVMSLR
ncbi:GNAT family N-acetyltransferase [Brevibacillus dissolubilis]|uniref:GNAT family N-acetyltransferase n=1 Tax=Brevibacillus dissolubilis TaxID=1844116 RepID=UPI0011163740|nr:GNAT family N-acetyltransferase [Brevibacillus dissolubilis]